MSPFKLARSSCAEEEPPTIGALGEECLSEAAGSRASLRIPGTCFGSHISVVQLIYHYIVAKYDSVRS